MRRPLNQPEKRDSAKDPGGASAWFSGGWQSMNGGVGLRLSRVLIALCVQIGAMYVILQAYSIIRRSIWQRSPDIAFAHAEDIIAAQRFFGLSVERIELPLQRFALEHDWVIDILNAYYRNMKVAVFASAALALIVAPIGFRRVRRLFLLTTVIAFPWFALYPLAPPRFMTDYAFVDTLATVGGTVSKSGGLAGANQYAAMPSMHMGWSTMAAMWIIVAIPWKRVGIGIGGIHVAMMALAVMATGNHYWLDIAGGFGVVAAALACDWALRRWARIS